ncbi:hypothetical protein [Pseudonocardia acaciae]|uniref:hypothetical protein n=1 Tax=Pseudonocardia acaciae TaxID=551276 RepID=UPI0012EE37F0|nr:hypothetical protein [Pseudonocardia acaciae]
MLAVVNALCTLVIVLSYRIDRRARDRAWRAIAEERRRLAAMRRHGDDDPLHP